jgi:hypothetical protein
VLSGVKTGPAETANIEEAVPAIVLSEVKVIIPIS